MEKIKTIIQGIFIGFFILGLAFCVYQGVRMYKAIAYVQADIRGIDSFLKYQIDQGLLKMPEQKQ